MFGAKRRQTRELMHEILKPIMAPKDMTERSHADFEKQMRSVVDRGKSDELYNKQTGWSKGEQ